MTDERQPIGPSLDAIGVKVTLDPDQQITEAIVIAKINDFASGATMLGMYHSEGLDWIAQLGLLAAGRHAMECADMVVGDEDDE